MSNIFKRWLALAIFLVPFSVGGCADEAAAPQVGFELDDTASAFEASAKVSPTTLPSSAYLGDNDWSGSTTYFGGAYCSPSSSCSSTTSSWRYRTGSHPNYYYGDLRSTSSTNKYGYYWNARGSSTATFATFYAYIPYSGYATATVTYTMWCSSGFSKTVSVNQNSYGGTWLDLGSVQAGYLGTCSMEVQRTGWSGYAAADAVAMNFYEFTTGP